MSEPAAGERGMMTIQYVLAIGMSLLLFVMLADLMVQEFERSAVRAAVDEGARAGANVDSSASDCERRGRDVVENLVGRALRDSIQLRCSDVAGSMHATAIVTFRSWVPFLPDRTVRLFGSAPKERD